MLRNSMWLWCWPIKSWQIPVPAAHLCQAFPNRLVYALVEPGLDSAWKNVEKGNSSTISMMYHDFMIHHSQVAIFWHTSPPLGSCCERAVESNVLPRSTIRPAFLRARASLRSMLGASGMVVIESEKGSRDGPKGIQMPRMGYQHVLMLSCLQCLKWRAMIRAQKAWVWACSFPANSASKSWRLENWNT